MTASTPDRRYVLAGVVVLLGLLTGAILLEVMGTILFAITVAYVLAPVQRWLVRRGLSEWTAGVLATLAGFLSVLVVVSPILLTLYWRYEELEAVIEELPEEFTLSVLQTELTISAEEAQALATAVLEDVVVSLATAAPVLAVKASLFVLLLFGLLLKGREAARAGIAPVPTAYRDVVFALAKRARETLYAIYVLQVVTSVATFAVAYPFFWALGYDLALVLAILAGILQFVPIVGPSVLVAPIALYELVLGDPAVGALVGVGGMLLVAWAPDVAVRPRLARRSAGLPGSLYFVGFTGGLFTLGAIGVVVGPLIVAVFVEAVSLLADEIDGDRTLEELAEEALEDESEGTTGTEARLVYDDATGAGAADAETTDANGPAGR